MSQDPLDIDGLKAIWIITGIWLIALVAQLIGLVNWDREVLVFGLIIGGLLISFLTRRRRNRRRQR